MTLLEDAPDPEDRIYQLKDAHEPNAAVSLLGSEIASLCQWWQAEKQRASEAPKSD